MASPTPIADDWIVDTLTGDATLMGSISGVWSERNVPQGTATPYVTFGYRGGSVLRVVGAVRYWHDLLYDIKAVGIATAYDTLVTIANRMDLLLELTSGSAEGGSVVVSEFEAVVPVPEDEEGGVIYENITHRYRLKVQEA